jgi:hypothetical protein
MSEGLERAQEGLEHAHEDAEHRAEAEGRAATRRIAVLIAMLAAALALAEMGEKAAQNEYMTQHVALSDDWAFYQAKTVRADMAREHAETLESLPNAAADPELHKRAEAARQLAARLDDDEASTGRKQLAERAKQRGEARTAAFERYHRFELASGALQIAIVLASVSVVVRVSALAIGAGVLGGLASLFALAIALGLA